MLSFFYNNTLYQALTFRSVIQYLELRQRGRFAGFSLYVSDTSVSSTADIKSSSLCYKDGPQLPPLIFSTTCIEYGRYVVFYNERLNNSNKTERYENGNVFTELCEVVVKGKFL